MYDNQHIPENEQAMNNTISGSSKSRIHRPPQRDGGEPYEPAPFRPVGRQPELGGRKKDEGAALKLVVRRNKAGPSGMSNYDHNLSLLVRCAAIAWERQATYQYRQVSYHREAASEVPSRTEVVDLQELNVEDQHWHGQS